MERTRNYLVLLLLLLKVVEVWRNRRRRQLLLIPPLSRFWHRLGRRRMVLLRVHAARRVHCRSR